MMARVVVCVYCDGARKQLSSEVGIQDSCAFEGNVEQSTQRNEGTSPKP